MLPEDSFWFLLFRDEGMAKTVKYDAFISYRHCESDSDNQSGAIVIYARTEDNSDAYFKVYPVTYEQLISMADEFLSGYEPDERVKEKYSLG